MSYYEELPELESHESHFLSLELKDWTEELGFDPSRYGVNVGAGTVDGERIGLMSALVCAISMHRIHERFKSKDE